MAFVILPLIALVMVLLIPVILPVALWVAVRECIGTFSYAFEMLNPPLLFKEFIRVWRDA